jgi:hypothetical protein
MPEAGVVWRNRIVGHGEADPRELVANPDNFRGHPQAQRGALVGGIREVGYIRSVTVNQQTGRIIDGHLRVEEAIRAGQTTIAVEYVDLSQEEERLALLLLDPIAAMATTEAPKLDMLLRDVETGEAAVSGMLAELAERAGLGYEFPQIVDNTGLEDDRTNRLKPGKGQAIISIGTWSGRVDYELVQQLAQVIQERYGEDADEALPAWCGEYVEQCCPAGR